MQPWLNGDIDRGMKAFLFPGQGSQFVGMAKELVDADKTLSDMAHSADEILGIPLTKLMFEGPEDELKQTEYTQPALFVHSALALQTIDQDASYVAGHSLGEFSALFSAGVFSFEDGLSIVRKRGELMAEAGNKSKGAMAAIIGLDDEKVAALCRDVSNVDQVVVPANYNCPGQLVISGHESAVVKAAEMASEYGARMAKVLPVSGAFHSPLMSVIQEEFQAYLNTFEFNTPKIPVVTNVSAEPQTDPELLRSQLVDQLVSPVRWTESIQKLISLGVSEIVEIGSGNVLQGLMRRIDRSINVSKAG